MTSINQSPSHSGSNQVPPGPPPSPTIPIVVTQTSRAGASPAPSDDSRSTSTPPPEVRTDNASGVEDGALELAKQFMDKMGNLARKCPNRGALSELYLTTQAAWAPQEIQEDPSKQRHFKQVLFALAHGMKLVRVRDQGRTLFWNRYRDNAGVQLEEERSKFTERQTQRVERSGYPQRQGYDDRRGQRQGYDDRRGQRQDYDDRRGQRQGYNDRRGQHQGYDDRRGQHQGYDDRRGQRQDYDDRRGQRQGYNDRRGQRQDHRQQCDRRDSPHPPREPTPDSKGWTQVGSNSRSHRGRD